MIRAAFFVALFFALHASAAAHHGGGTFDGSKEIKLSGTFTDWTSSTHIHGSTSTSPGRTGRSRSTVRDAFGNGARRSGWSPEMFKKGEHLTSRARPIATIRPPAT